MPPQQPHIHQTEHRARNRNPQARPERRRIIRRLLLDKHITRHKVRAIANTQDNRSANGQTRSPAQVVHEPGGGHGHLDERPRAHAKQTEVAHARADAVALRVHDVDDPADEHEGNSAQNEGEAPPGFSGDESAQDLEDHAGDPHRDGHCLCSRSFPAELCQNRRDERRHAGGGHVAAKKHERREEDLVVADHAEPLCALDVDLLVAFVEAERLEKVLFLGGGENFGALGEVGDEDEDEEGDADCEDAFEDEDPSGPD
jgi:hypothetical protein